MPPGRRPSQRAALEQEAEARQAKAREREAEARIKEFLETLKPPERERLDTEALAGVDPETRTAYETAPTPQGKRLLLTALREVIIRQRLGLPAVD